MGDRDHGWTTVGHRLTAQRLGRDEEAELELRERQAINAWDQDSQWPGIDKPLFSGPEAKKFDTRLAKLEDLGFGAFGRVEKVIHDSVCLARKRITRRRGFTIEDLRQEGLTMRKLDHRHVVKLVATYAPRAYELCLLIWPAAVCNLNVLLEDLECLRLGEGDRDDILERLAALDVTDLGAIEATCADQTILPPPEKCPFDYLRTVIGCVARAMAHCHANHVRHLDIKPSNILLRPDRVYLADFGISRDVSGQDQTTTEGLPGTERWRAPELYGEHGSSMQLSDMYSLGLVYLNIATVLYNVRLAEFDECLNYSSRLSREEQLQVREKRMKGHLDKLTAHALTIPPFRFTYEGQETVRPRPLTTLISRMVATDPRQRLSADKIDERLSMLGGINQIYHGACCKRPISWVEDKWDRKFAALISLQKENELQRERIKELERKGETYEALGETYEARLESERHKHEQDISRLQALLRDAEERCQRLDVGGSGPRNRSRSSRGSHGHDVPRPRQMPRRGQHAPANTASTASVAGPNRQWAQAAKAESNPNSHTPQHVPAQRYQPRVAQAAQAAAQQITAISTRRDNPVTQTPPRKASPAQRSPSITSLPGYALRSRGSGSKLPRPITPSRSSTPVLGRDASTTDSSMTSSVFSRQSLETLPTPTGSPILERTPASEDKTSKPRWSQLPGESPLAKNHHVDPAPPAAVPPGVTASPEVTDIAVDKAVPALLPMKSWADVAKLEKKRRPR